MEYTVKKGGHADIKRIYPMLEYDFRDWERPSEALLQLCFLRCGGQLLLLKDENGVEAGYAVMLCAPGCEYVLLGWLGVYPGVRGGGVGKKFLRLIREFYASKRGVILEVTEWPELEKARHLHDFYEREGWRDVPGWKYEFCGRPSALMCAPEEGLDILESRTEYTIRWLYSRLYTNRQMDEYLSFSR